MDPGAGVPGLKFLFPALSELLEGDLEDGPDVIAN
jgi:hypothetical protein